MEKEIITSWIKKYWGVLLVLCLSYWAIKPFFIDGFFPMHDATQVQRVFEMNKSLRDGMFPVRWVSDLGYNYGYPIFNFYAPLAYYVGSFFNLIGFDALIATKIMMVVGIMLAGVFMYLFARSFWGELGGLISGLLYLYAPYHAVDIYVRGDVAEFWAYAFIPLAFLGVYKVYTYALLEKHKEKNAKEKSKHSLWFWVIAASVGYACIILSHNLTAMMVTPFLFVFATLLYIAARKQAKRYKNLLILLSVVFGILLASFYWLPTLTEMQYTNVLSQVGGGADYKDHFVCLPQLWNSPWGYGGSTEGCVDGLSFKIGKLHILFALFSFVALFYFWKKNKLQFCLILFCLLSLLLSIFLMLKESEFIWGAISHMAFFQYPWRFLVLASFFTSFLAGATVFLITVLINKKYRKGMWVVGFFAIFIVVFFNAKVFVPQTVLNKTAKDFTDFYTLSWITSRTSDEYMPVGFRKPNNVNEVPQNKINKSHTVRSVSQKTQEIIATVQTKSTTNVPVNLAYFPAWHVFIDNKQVWFKYFSRGLIVTVPAGKHTVAVRFIQTPVEQFADFLSFAGVIILLLGIIYPSKHHYERKKT